MLGLGGKVKMFKDEMTLDRLKPNERAIILAIRRWQKPPDSYFCPILSSAIYKDISIFITILEYKDPFAINVSQVFEQEFQIFEVQLLFAISEQLAGNTSVVSELLAWWFAASDQDHAFACLKRIAHSMESLSVTLKSVNWIQNYFYSKTSKNSKNQRPVIAYKTVTPQISISEPIIIH